MSDALEELGSLNAKFWSCGTIGPAARNAMAEITRLRELVEQMESQQVALEVATMQAQHFAKLNSKHIDEVVSLLALARRVHAECGPHKIKQEDEVFWGCKCGAVGITELNHKPDCLWLAADALLKGAKAI